MNQKRGVREYEYNMYFEKISTTCIIAHGHVMARIDLYWHVFSWNFMSLDACIIFKQMCLWKIYTPFIIMFSCILIYLHVFEYMQWEIGIYWVSGKFPAKIFFMNLRYFTYLRQQFFLS